MERRVSLKAISYCVAAVVASGMLTACGAGSETDPTNPGVSTVPVDTNVGSMEASPVIDYEKPEQLPGLIVDREGYSSQEVKYAWVVASQMPASFKVVSEANGEVVLEVEPEAVHFDAEKNVYSAKVKFADVTKAGTYHLEESSLGQSYSFDIADNYYVDRFDALLEEEYAKCKDMTITMDEMYSLVYIGERYTGSVGNPESLWENVRDWLEAVDATTLDTEDAAMYVAILAKASFNFKNNDSASKIEDAQLMADAWGKRVGTIMTELKAKEDEINQDTLFLMYAELYRLLDNKEYGNKISGMYDYIKGLENIHSSRKLLYGSMCYMNTHRTVNRNLCDLFMQSLLMSCEDISGDKTLIAPQNENRTETDILLDYAQQLVAMNYILDGYQYNELVVSIMHYMSGRNYEGYVCDIAKEYPDDAIVILSWLSLLEKNGKLDPAAPVVWQYSW